MAEEFMKRKKLVFVTAILAFSFCQILFAQESDLKRFSLGGIWRADDFRSSGGIEFGITISPGKFVARNYFLAEGFGLRGDELSGGGFSLSDKIQLGGKMDLGKVSVVAYGFAQIGWVAFSTTGKAMFAQPFFIELSGGGGIEFLLENNFSFMVEFGGGGYIPTKSGKINGGGFQSLLLGCRKYF